MNRLTVNHVLRHPLFPLLLMCGALFLVAIDWGLPASWSWAADELVPTLVLDGLSKRFSQGWHTQYPLFHFYVLSAVYAPLQFFGVSADYTLALAGRFVSVVMGLGSLVALYALGRKFLSVGWAVFAVAVFGFAPQVVYYAKLANLEIPYTFWLLWSFYFLWNVIEFHRGKDYLLFTFCAITAICTKEQVFGFYVLLVPLVFYSRYRSAYVGRVFFDYSVVYSFFLALICFLLFENVFGNLEGFRAHLDLITGSKFKSFRMFRPTLEGHWGMIKLSVEQIAIVATIPIFGLSIVGIGMAALRKRRSLWLILAIISYQIFFIHVVLYAFDRFFISVVAVLVLFAAFALQTSAGKFRLLSYGIAGLLMLYQFGRGVELNLMMINDNRYAAEAWLEQVPKDRVIGMFGQRRYLPRTEQFAVRKTVSPFRKFYHRINPQPDCLLISYTPPELWPRMHPARDFLPALENGAMGMRSALTLPEGRVGTMLYNPRMFFGKHQVSYSNLAKIDPEVRIYSRGERCLPVEQPVPQERGEVSRAD